MHRRHGVARLSVVVAVAVAAAAGLVGGATGTARAAGVVITVEAGGNYDEGPVSPWLLGANHRYPEDGYGAWDSAHGTPVADVAEKARRMGMKVLRWPGGTVGNTVWWKGTIGATRMCQRDGRMTDIGDPANPADDVLPANYPSYGLDEHMAFVAAIGAEAQIMVPMAISNPIDAADLVEYLNTPADDGVNPNGGTDWAQVRKANGHPEPYHVKRWELGNENYHTNQRYWMSMDRATALRQYIVGGSRRITGERLGKLDLTPRGDKQCGGSTAPQPSDGTPNQVFEFNYPSAEVGTFVLRVDGVTWTRVDSLSAAPPGAKVYELRPHIGEVRFGDGVTHGAIPPQGASIVADYTSVHEGFVRFYQRMKAVDPTIEVCAAWGTEDFPAVFKSTAPAGSRYDCLAAHPYTHFKGGNIDDWDDTLEAHDWHMISAWQERNRIIALREAVKANTASPHPYIAISEYGALWGPDQNNPFPQFAYSTTHALYMATQWIHWLEQGVQWAEGNDFTSNAWYTLLSSKVTGYLFSAEAVAREAVKPMFEAGGTRIEEWVTGNPVRDPDDTVMCDGGAPAICRNTYDKLKITATRDPAGNVYLMVVNRSPFRDDPVTAQVVLHGFTGNGSATVRQVAPDHYTSRNDTATPQAVTMTQTTRTVGATSFTATFPPYSITLFHLPRA